MACFTPEERQSFTNFTNMGFCDTFRELYPGKIKYSFWDIRDKSRKENKGWRLDYNVVSKAILPCVKESEIHNDFWGSDHCPVSLTLDIDMVNLTEFKQYMSLDGGFNDYQSVKAERDARKSSNEGTLLPNGQLDKNYNVAGLDNGGIKRALRKPPPGYLDEDRKSDLEDFEDDMNEQNIMNMGMRGKLGMGSINSDEMNPFS